MAKNLTTRELDRLGNLLYALQQQAPYDTSDASSFRRIYEILDEQRPENREGN